tara:strand:+ start:1377 stop:1646 length:270 start_codon:yes stop_codon:yes gene_type:complete
MQRLILAIKLIGLSSLLLGSILASLVIICLYIFLGLGWFVIGVKPPSFLEILSLLSILILLLALIYLYWRFIVLGVFNNVRKSLIQKAK